MLNTTFHRTRHVIATFAPTSMLLAKKHASFSSSNIGKMNEDLRCAYAGCISGRFFKSIRRSKFKIKEVCCGFL